MKYLIIITSVFIILSCRKNKPEFDGVNCSGNCYILTGKVVDTPSNVGLSDVELKFYYRARGYSLFTDLTTYLGKTISSTNGEYKFQFDGTKYKTNAGYYYIKATKKDYFYDPLNQNEVSIFNLDSSNFNIPFFQNFALFRLAKLSVRFKATTVTNFEFLTFTYSYGNTGSGFILKGRRAIDTTVIFPTAGDIRTFIQWNARGNGVDINKNDTLLIPPGGIIQYQVNL